MSIQFSTTDADLVVKRDALGLLRKLNLRNLSDLEPHAMTWADLNSAGKDIKVAARDLIDGIGDSTPVERAQKIEATYDVLTEALDYIEAEKDVRTKIGNREPREHGGDPRTPRGAQGTGTANGGEGIGELESIERILRPERQEQQQFRSHAQAKGAHEYRGLTLGRYLRSMVTGGKNDVERRALSEGSDSAGGYTVPTFLGATMIDALRANSVAVAAGAQTYPLTTNVNNIAKLVSDPTPGWRNEAGGVAESDPTFGNVSLEPKSLAVTTVVSHEVLEDSLNLERELPRILSVAMGKELDRVALLGTGTAPEPRGIANVAGIGTTAHDAALANYLPLVRARTGILSANAGPVSAIIMHPRDEGTLAGLLDGQGQPLMQPRVIEQIPMLTTTAIPTDGGTGTDESTIFLGNFRHLIIGIRQEVRIEVLRHTLASNLQYTFLAHMRADIAVQHAGAFHTITGVQG